MSLLTLEPGACAEDAGLDNALIFMSGGVELFGIRILLSRRFRNHRIDQYRDATDFREHMDCKNQRSLRETASKGVS